MKIKTIVIENETPAQKALTDILKNHCHNDVDLVDVKGTVDESIDSIRKNKPDLVFLDIKLGANDEGAFDVLKSFDEIDFYVAFTSILAQTDVILRAVNKFNARKYLLKPLDIDEVLGVVKEAKKEIVKKSKMVDFPTFVDQIAQSLNGLREGRLAIPQKNNYLCISRTDIIMVRSSGNSTVFFVKDNNSIISPKSLKYFQEQLPENKFVRTSRSFIVNVDHVIKYCNEKGGTIYLNDNCSAALTRNYFDNFFNMLNTIN